MRRGCSAVPDESIPVRLQYDGAAAWPQSTEYFTYSGFSIWDQAKALGQRDDIEGAVGKGQVHSIRFYELDIGVCGANASRHRDHCSADVRACYSSGRSYGSRHFAGHDAVAASDFQDAFAGFEVKGGVHPFSLRHHIRRPCNHCLLEGQFLIVDKLAAHHPSPPCGDRKQNLITSAIRRAAGPQENDPNPPHPDTAGTWKTPRR